MNIQYYKKSVYGKDLLYVSNPEQARLLETLTGQKTINQGIINAMTKLGHNFEQVLN